MPGGLGEVFDERSDEGPRGAGAGAGGEQVERAVLVRNSRGSNSSPGSGFTASRTAGVGEACECLGDGHPDRVTGPRIGVDHRLRASPTNPARRCGWLARIADRVGGGRGGERPLEQLVSESCSIAAAWSRAWIADLALPSQNPPDSTPPDDSPVDDARPAARIIAVSGSSQPRIGDHRTPLPSTSRKPSVRRWGSKTATGPRSLAGADRGGDVVGPGGGRDDGAGRVENRVDDQVQSLARAGRADHEDGVFDRCPDLTAAASPEEVADVLGLRFRDGRPQGLAAPYERLPRCGGVDVAACGRALQPVRIAGGPMADACYEEQPPQAVTASALRSRRTITQYATGERPGAPRA